MIQCDLPPGMVYSRQLPAIEKLGKSGLVQGARTLTFEVKGKAKAIQVTLHIRANGGEIQRSKKWFVESMPEQALGHVDLLLRPAPKRERVTVLEIKLGHEELLVPRLMFLSPEEVHARGSARKTILKERFARPSRARPQETAFA